MSGLRLYFKLISISIQSQLQYKASFIMMTLGYFVITVVDFFGLWVLFARFGNLEGFTFAEAALFYGMVHVAFAISEAWGHGFHIFPRQVRNGEFDRVLLRPRNAVLQVLGHEFQIIRLGRLSQGLIVLIWAVVTLEVNWSIGKIILLVSSILGGVLVFTGLIVLQATFSFWSVQSLEIFNSFTYGGVETAQFPLSVYKSWLSKFFIFVIPLGCINYFPAMNIIQKNDPLGYPSWAAFISPIAGVIFFYVSLRIWKFGIRHYRSTGS